MQIKMYITELLWGLNDSISKVARKTNNRKHV